MKLPRLGRKSAVANPGVSGVARLDKRTKNLTKRLQPGEIAIIDHVDLDRVSAEALVACAPAAVVNARTSISGRYPNLGPAILLEADIPLLDSVGPFVFDEVNEGDEVRIDGKALYLAGGEEPIADGQRHTMESVSDLTDAARAGLSTQIEAFAANTLEYLRNEKDLLLDGVGVPDVDTSFRGRHVLVVIRGYHYKEDLAMLRSYIREYRPLLVGVDGGADALLEVGMKPDVIVGDMDSVTDKALMSGAELVVHAYRDGRAPGLDRIEKLGLSGTAFPATGTSEDVAILLADEKGAELIVAVGTHYTLIEFLDKGRAGMASSFLTRLRVGGKLIDAKGVSRLYRSRIPAWTVVLLVVAGLVAVTVALWVTPTGEAYREVIASWWDQFEFWLRGII
ncbi:MAG TPA: putative cytokinetic ring protein SteA [Jiangellaceae bacterium]